MKGSDIKCPRCQNPGILQEVREAWQYWTIESLDPKTGISEVGELLKTVEQKEDWSYFCPECIVWFPLDMVEAANR